MKDYNELKSILPGLQEDMPKPFYMIGELLDYGSFELCIQEKDGRKEYIIPYIMNDAVECYLTLENASRRGDYQPEQEVTEVELLVPQEDGRYGLIVHQGYDNVVTLWFETLVMHVACYRYHEIGHFWVKGQEQWRQLVYMVGTMADKYRYMGPEYCNETEIALQRLIYFPPFRRWSPVVDDLMADHFPLREEGVETALCLAKEVNDTEFISLVQQYANNATEKMEVYLSRQLLSPKREALYQHIYELVQKASSPYPPRDYGETKNLEIRQKRRQVEKELHSCGYVGHYPEYHKKNTQVLVTEEQPFTMLEWEHFSIPFYNKKKIQKIAEKSDAFGRFPTFFGEKETSDFLEAIAMDMDSDVIRSIPKKAMKAVITEPQGVLIGRCGNYVYNEQAIKVFLSGDKKKRVQAIKEKHGCTEREAARLVDKTDEKRSAYHNYYTGQEWGQAGNYDLCLDETALGVDGVVKMICTYIELVAAKRG